MKLVRDNLKEKPHRQYLNVGGHGFTSLLIHKAYEELHEVAEQMLMPDTDKAHLTEELADVYEVLLTIAHWFEIDPETIEDVRNQKLEICGGFTGRKVIV